MFEDVFEDNKKCILHDRDFEHGSVTCDSEDLHCRVCINGRWADKLRPR